MCVQIYDQANIHISVKKTEEQEHYRNGISVIWKLLTDTAGMHIRSGIFGLQKNSCNTVKVVSLGNLNPEKLSHMNVIKKVCEETF